MTQDNIDIIGKNVKDMYGTPMGRIIGTSTDIDGSIQTVGVDCGFRGLDSVPYEQLVIQPDVVIFVPKWRLDSQRLWREKQLTLRRLKALLDVISEDDDVKEDAEMIHAKYRSKLAELDEAEHIVKAKLEARLTELEDQAKAAKMLLFDAKVQHKGDEISPETFETVKARTSEMLEHTAHEVAELQNVQKRLADLDAEVQEAASQPLQESAVSYLDSRGPQAVQSILPEAPTEPVSSREPIREPAAAEPEDLSAVPAFGQGAGETPAGHETLPKVPAFGQGADGAKDSAEPGKDAQKSGKGDGDWLSRMEAQ